MHVCMHDVRIHMCTGICLALLGQGAHIAYVPRSMLAAALGLIIYYIVESRVCACAQRTGAAASVNHR